MRIEILTGGLGSVSNLNSGLNSLRSSITSTIDDLRSAKRQLDNLTGGVGNLQNAYNSIQQRVNFENGRLMSLNTLTSQTSSFISNTITTDVRVARIVNSSQERFFAMHEWLRPPVKEEKSFWESFAEGWNNFWGGVGEALKSAWDSIVTFVKEHSEEIAKVLIAVVIIAAVAAVIALTGGGAVAFLPAFLSAFASGLKVAAIAAAVSGALCGALAAIKGGDVLEAVGGGFVNGFLFGAVGFAAGTATIGLLGKGFLVSNSLLGAIVKGGVFGGISNGIASPISTALVYFIENGTLEGSGGAILSNTIIGIGTGIIAGGILGGSQRIVSEIRLRMLENSISNDSSLTPTDKGRAFENKMIELFEKLFPDTKYDSQCHLNSEQLLNKQGNVSYQKPDLLVETGNGQFANYDFKWGGAGKTYIQNLLTGGGNFHQFDTIISGSHTGFASNVVPAGTPFIEIHPSVFSPSESLLSVIGLPINTSLIVDGTAVIQSILSWLRGGE